MSNQLLRRWVLVWFKNPVVSLSKIDKHCKLPLSFQKDRLDGDDGTRNDRCQLVRDTTRVCQISDDEPGHAGQRGDCPGQVLAGWLVEVKQDWKIIPLPQLIA